MSRFRDINTVSLLGTAITGVQRVSIRGEGTVLDYSGDDDAGVQDLGLTKRFYTIEIEALDSAKYRDIGSPEFTDKDTPTTTALNEVLGIDMAIESDPLQDSSEAATWLEYIGVTNVRGSLDVTMRDVEQAVECIASEEMGVRGKVLFDTHPPKSTHGLPDTGVETGMDNLVLVGVEGQGAHRDLGQGVLHFQGHGTGGAAPTFEGSLVDKEPGDVGTFSAVFPSATGGSDKTVTISNCVCVRARVSVEHGGLLRLTWELQAYSSDGTTDPLAVT